MMITTKRKLETVKDAFTMLEKYCRGSRNSITIKHDSTGPSATFTIALLLHLEWGDTSFSFLHSILFYVLLNVLLQLKPVFFLKYTIFKIYGVYVFRVLQVSEHMFDSLKTLSKTYQILQRMESERVFRILVFLKTWIFTYRNSCSIM